MFHQKLHFVEILYFLGIVFSIHYRDSEGDK